MTIFRFSWILLLCLASCTEEAVDAPTAKPTFSYEFRVLSDGKTVDPVSLLKDRAKNPNAFTIENDGRKWMVDGKIQIIREFDPELDRVTGFNVPLKVADVLRIPDWLSQDGAEHSSPIQDLSVNLVGYDVNRAAQLKVGQTLTVACRGLRSFEKTLVFDDCRSRDGVKGK